MPSIAMVILFAIPSYVSFSVSSQAQRLILVIVFINTCLAPLLAIFFLKRIGVISSVLLDERTDRIYPVLVSVFFYLFTYYLFRQANLPSVMSYFIMGATLLTLDWLYSYFLLEDQYTYDIHGRIYRISYRCFFITKI